MYSQVAAYAKSDLGNIIGGRHIQCTGIVRVGTKHENGFEAKFRSFAQMNGDWKRFKSAIDIDDAGYEPFDPDAIREIPESVELTIDREQLAATEVAA